MSQEAIINYETTAGRSEIFSGIDINQNIAPSSNKSYAETDKGIAYQIFKLPSNYAREEKYCPDITGMQVCVNVDEISDEAGYIYPRFDYTLGYKDNESWITLASGITEGIHASGEQVWADIYFSENIEVSPIIQEAELKFGLTTEKVKGWWFSSGHPYANGHGVSISGTDLPEEGSYMFRLLSYSADSDIDWLGNSFRNVVYDNSPNDINTYFSNNDNAYWFSKPNPSQFSVESLYFDITDGEGNAQVINEILINPITNGPVFHVYYSNSETKPSVISEWDNLIWSPVAAEYKLGPRNAYVLPEPITAKYVCLEFSRLQAQYYAPGIYQQPILYREYPEWLYNYFNSNPKNTMDANIASKVKVVFNKLKLGFEHQLSHVEESPIVPEIEPGSETQPSSSVGEGIDPSMLENINTNLAPYTAPLGSNVTGHTVLANFARNNARSYSSPVESLNVSTAANTTYVSVPEREELLKEQNRPNPYFFFNARHQYKICQAEFEYDKAYFVGIKEIAFLREDYNILKDSPLYIETTGDNQNSLINDFYSINGNWQVINEEGFPA